MLFDSQDRRRALAVIAVALLVVTAGCSGFLGGGNGNENGDENGNGNGNGLPPKKSPGEDQTVYSTTGNFDGEKLAQNHSDALHQADSFTLKYTIERSGATEETITFLLELDKFSGEGYSHASIDSDGQIVTTEVYTSDGTSYFRSAVESDSVPPSYDKETEPYNDASFTPVRNESVGNEAELQAVFSQIDELSWTQQGDDNYKGITVTRYTADTDAIERFVDESSLALDESQSVSNVSTGSATLLVTPDGTVRYFELSMSGTNPNGEDQSLSVIIQYPNIGSTNVQTPDWIDEAESETAS